MLMNTIKVGVTPLVRFSGAKTPAIAFIANKCYNHMPKASSFHHTRVIIGTCVTTQLTGTHLEMSENT